MGVLDTVRVVKGFEVSVDQPEAVFRAECDGHVREVPMQIKLVVNRTVRLRLGEADVLVL